MNFKDFKDFKKDVESAFNAMIADNLFVVNVDKDLLWMSYLLSFEDETIRQDHNCNACKSFIRHYGKVVAIDPQTYKVKTFWDDVHTDKLKDKAAREAAKDKAAEKARLTELLAKKQSEKMESMSEDEIRQRLAELG